MPLAAFKALDEDGELSVNIAAHLVWGSPKFGTADNDANERLIATRAAYRTKHVEVNYAKVWLDGAPLPPHPTQVDIDASGRIDESANQRINE